MKIRKFHKNDLNNCIKIIGETLGMNNAKKARIDFLEGISPKTKEYSYLKRIVAQKDMELVGIAGVYRLVTHPKEFVGICWYGVKPEEQKRGIGSLLMKEMEKHAKKSGHKVFFVWAAKKAVPFYEKFGFKVTKKIKLKPVEANILMTKDLRENLRRQGKLAKKNRRFSVGKYIRPQTRESLMAFRNQRFLMKPEVV